MEIFSEMKSVAFNLIKSQRQLSSMKIQLFWWTHQIIQTTYMKWLYESLESIFVGSRDIHVQKSSFISFGRGLPLLPSTIVSHYPESTKLFIHSLRTPHSAHNIFEDACSWRHFLTEMATTDTMPSNFIYTFQLWQAEVWQILKKSLKNETWCFHVFICPLNRLYSIFLRK